MLFATIKGYIESDFPNTTWTDATGSAQVTLTSTEQINAFIRQAEQRVYNTVNLLASRDVDTGNLTAGDPYLTLPADWLSMFALAVVDSSGRYEYLINKNVDFIRTSFPTPTFRAQPTHYAMSNDTQALLGPTPDADYTYYMEYFRYPESIVTAGNTWLGDNFDSILLYGALLEAHTFTKGEEDLTALYQGRYNEAMVQLNELGEGRNRQDAFRSGQFRYPVM